MQKTGAERRYCPVCGRDLGIRNDATQLEVGTVVEGGEGRSYQVGKAVERGPMGMSYVARDLERGMVVMLQEFLPEAFDSPSPGIRQSGLRRMPDGEVCCPEDARDDYAVTLAAFVGEGRRLVDLTSDADFAPSVARVLDCFEAKGTAYMVTERVGGFTLDALMQTQSSCEPTMLLRRVMSLARDVGKLHEAGIVHGGISPLHVMCEPNGTLRLVWSGRACGIVSSSSDFVTPEHCADFVRDVLRLPPESNVPKHPTTPSADVYSLCATLYYGLTGVVPASASERMRARRDALPDPLIPLCERGVILPDVIERDLMRGLALLPNERPVSMEEFVGPIERHFVQVDCMRNERERMAIGRERCVWCMAEMRGAHVCPDCGRIAGTYRAPAHHLEPGTLLRGRYLVGASRGEGGFGITYVGFDATLERRVAIKEYFPEGVAQRAAADGRVTEARGVPSGSLERGGERFLEEARALARPRVGSAAAVALDFFAENGTAYIVMEYVDGETLREYVHRRGGRLPMDELLGLLGPVFATLGELHEAGLVHRDVSPDNVVVGEGVARLVDFGLACGVEGSARVAQNALTRDYAPPEQYANGGHGPWTDVYALCATMYECLTGSVPPSALDRLAGERIVPPTECGASLSTGQEAALMRGLSLRTSERFRSVADLEDALHRGRSTRPAGGLLGLVRFVGRAAKALRRKDRRANT